MCSLKTTFLWYLVMSLLISNRLLFNHFLKKFISTPLLQAHKEVDEQLITVLDERNALWQVSVWFPSVALNRSVSNYMLMHVNTRVFCFGTRPHCSFWHCRPLYLIDRLAAWVSLGRSCRGSPLISLIGVSQLLLATMPTHLKLFFCGVPQCRSFAAVWYCLPCISP